MTGKAACSISLRYGGGKASIAALVLKCLLRGRITAPRGSRQSRNCLEGSTD